MSTSADSKYPEHAVFRLLYRFYCDSSELVLQAEIWFYCRFTKKYDSVLSCLYTSPIWLTFFAFSSSSCWLIQIASAQINRSPRPSRIWRKADSRLTVTWNALPSAKAVFVLSGITPDVWNCSVLIYQIIVAFTKCGVDHCALNDIRKGVMLQTTLVPCTCPALQRSCQGKKSSSGGPTILSEIRKAWLSMTVI